MRINCVVAAAVCAVMLGCASEYPPIAAQGVAKESFRAWMAKYDPVAEEQENGIYLRFIERGPEGSSVPKPDTSLIRVNYTLCDLGGVVAETRSSQVARLLKTYKPITHFTDDLIYYYSRVYPEYPTVCEGLRSAFKYLRAGDSVRIYIPIELGYSSSVNPKGMNVNSGYVGESLGYLDMPCYFDLRVSEVINNPAQWEQNLLERYVFRHWGIPGSDSVIKGVYMRVLQDDPKATQITADSSVRYFYATRFLDNHLMLSNVTDVIHEAKYDYVSSPALKWPTAALTFSPSDFTGNSSQADTTNRKVLAAVLLKAKAGQTIEWVSVSGHYAFGSAGVLQAVPQILPYEPRRMQMRLLRWDEKDDNQSGYDFKLLY